MVLPAPFKEGSYAQRLAPPPAVCYLEPPKGPMTTESSRLPTAAREDERWISKPR